MTSSVRTSARPSRATPRSLVRLAAAPAALLLAVGLAGCGGSGSGGTTSTPASLAAEQLSLELESSIDRDNTTAFSEQLTTQWKALEPKAAQAGLTTSSDIDDDGGLVEISGGGVTCRVIVVNEPPAVTRACEGG